MRTAIFLYFMCFASALYLSKSITFLHFAPQLGNRKKLLTRKVTRVVAIMINNVGTVFFLVIHKVFFHRRLVSSVGRAPDRRVEGRGL